MPANSTTWFQQKQDSLTKYLVEEQFTKYAQGFFKEGIAFGQQQCIQLSDYNVARVIGLNGKLVPCGHALACIYDVHKEPADYMLKNLTIEVFRDTYNINIKLIDITPRLTPFDTNLDALELNYMASGERANCGLFTTTLDLLAEDLWESEYQGIAETEEFQERNWVIPTEGPCAYVNSVCFGLSRQLMALHCPPQILTYYSDLDPGDDKPLELTWILVVQHFRVVLVFLLS
ncbi:hypothetical protein B9Z19DRAFT_1124311 [Tuber borchii]|uniref:Uncharacterized protein n=1 Tax=Tuber borchii TaxID=42251 RepID=A0A2T6ZWY5_TUBBO|nr:hypothetical protein B9Z19DRAFT_1124311 [Tuber borchii]